MEVILENGTTYLKGYMTEAETRNRNGRIYPHNVAKIATLDLKNRISETGGVFSYLEHPSDHDSLEEEKSCGKIVEVSWDESTGRAQCKVEVFNHTEDGKKVLKSLSEGGTYGISTRGVGSLDKDGIVQEGLKFLTADLISTIGRQSCQVCSMSLTESVETRTNTMEDYLHECGCIYAMLDQNDKLLAESYLVKKFIEKLNNIKG